MAFWASYVANNLISYIAAPAVKCVCRLYCTKDKFQIEQRHAPRLNTRYNTLEPLMVRKTFKVVYLSQKTEIPQSWEKNSSAFSSQPFNVYFVNINVLNILLTSDARSEANATRQAMSQLVRQTFF